MDFGNSRRTQKEIEPSVRNWEGPGEKGYSPGMSVKKVSCLGTG